jgi:molecular chaperone DnaK
MCFQLEKLMKEHSDRLSDADKEPLQKAIDKTRETAKGDDASAIRSAVSDLEQASHALSKVLYEHAQATGTESAQAATPDRSDEDVIDADFEVRQSA